MQDINCASTLGAQTGTGLVYTAYKQGENSCVWINGSGSTRSLVKWSRVEPKKSADYAGNIRVESRRTTFVVINGVEYPLTTYAGSSFPDASALADRTPAWNYMCLLAGSTLFKTAMETGALPT